MRRLELFLPGNSAHLRHTWDPGGSSRAPRSVSQSQECLSSTGPLRAASLWVWRPLGAASQWGSTFSSPRVLHIEPLAHRHVDTEDAPASPHGKRTGRGGEQGRAPRVSAPSPWVGHTSVTGRAKSLHQPFEETTSRASISFSVTQDQSLGGDLRKEPVASNLAGERNQVMEVLGRGSRPGPSSGEGAVPSQTLFPFTALSPK